MTESNCKENSKENYKRIIEAIRREMPDFRIEGKYEPMKHQYVSAIFMAEHRRCFNLSTMRTGKTGSTILAYYLLRKTGRSKRMLVLAPLSTLRTVWRDSLDLTAGAQAHAMGTVRTLLLGQQKAKMAAEISAGPDIIVSNYEKLEKYYAELTAWRPDIVVIDECTAYANATTKRSKLIKKFLKQFEGIRVWGLTGTPGHDPLKVYSMVSVVNPEKLGNIRSMYQWRELTMVKQSPWSYNWVNRPDADQMMQGILQPAIRFDAKDVLDLPAVTKEAQYAEPTADTRSAVKDLQDSMMTLYKGQEITVQQKSTCVIRCLQILCGVVKPAVDSMATAVTGTPRDKLIEELIQSTDRKTVIFSPFVIRCHALTEYLNKHGYKTECVTGETSETKRAKIFSAFQNDDSLRVLVCHPRTVAFGVELAAADLMLFDGVCLSGDFTYGQALARLSSAKQTSDHIHVVHIFSSQLELKMIRALTEGQKMSAVIADAFTAATKESIL